MNNFQKQLADLQAQFMMNAFGVNPPIVVNPVVIAPIIAPIPEPIYYPTVYYQLYNEENFISYNDDEIRIFFAQPIMDNDFEIEDEDSESNINKYIN